MEPLTRKITVKEIANFFDDFEEKYLQPFDINPNSKLPHENQKVYRIKDYFYATYYKKICKYYIEEIEICKTIFMNIFFDGLIMAMQVENEDSKLKMMADYEHYDSINTADRTLTSNTNYTDGSSNTNTNRADNKSKAGALAGSIDAIQMGSVLKEDVRVIDTNKLPDFFDKNIRQYNQSVSVDNSISEVTITDNGTSQGTNVVTGSQHNKIRQGIEALNQFRAHSLQTRRLRAEFVQRFNVLFH